MTKDEIILAQQARIEQLRDFIERAQVSSGVCCCGDSMDGHPSPMTCDHTPVDMWDYHSAKLLEAASDDLSALRAHDAAILREAAEYCKQQADEWDSDRVLTFKNYAGNCADELNARAEAIEKGGV